MNIKLSPQKIKNYFYFVTAIIVIIILILMSLFLYKNFYETITQSRIITTLQKNVFPETINTDMFNEVLEKINKRTAPRELGEINNPFD